MAEITYLGAGGHLLPEFSWNQVFKTIDELRVGGKNHPASTRVDYEIERFPAACRLVHGMVT